MKNTVHKSAIIDKNAKIGKNVGIGPYSIVGPNVKIKNNVKVHSHVNIEGDTIINEDTEIFSFAGGEQAAKKFQIPFLGRIPLDPAIREGGDAGMPIVVANPDSPQSKVFGEIAVALRSQIESEESEKSGSSLSDMLKKLKEPMGLN